MSVSIFKLKCKKISRCQRVRFISSRKTTIIFFLGFITNIHKIIISFFIPIHFFLPLAIKLLIIGCSSVICLWWRWWEFTSYLFVSICMSKWAIIIKIQWNRPSYSQIFPWGFLHLPCMPPHHTNIFNAKVNVTHWLGSSYTFCSCTFHTIISASSRFLCFYLSTLRHRIQPLWRLVTNEHWRFAQHKAVNFFWKQSNV